MQHTARTFTTFPSLLTDGKALDIQQHRPLNNGMGVWRRMVTRWEPQVPSSFRGMLQAILFPRWRRRDTADNSVVEANARLRTTEW